MRAGINAVTAALVVGVLIGLALTPDGRDWLRRPTLLPGGTANASASPAPAASPPVAPAPVEPRLMPLEQRAARGQLRIGVFGDFFDDGAHETTWTAPWGPKID